MAGEEKEGREEGVLDEMSEPEFRSTEKVAMMHLPSTHFTRVSIQVPRLKADRG